MHRRYLARGWQAISFATSKRAAAFALITIASAFGMFVLPWLLPMPVRPIVSMSQVVGFTNRAAALSLIAGALCAGVLAYAARSRPAEPFVSSTLAGKYARLSRSLVWLVAAASGAIVIASGALLGGRPVLDSAYFVDRMLYVVNGSVPYTQFEFSYGPLLLYPQTWLFMVLRHVGVSVDWTYYLWLAGAQVLGVVLAAYVINRLAISSRLLKLLLLVALVIVDAPLIALNESLLRFVLPYALLLAVLHAVFRSGHGLSETLWALGAAVLTALVSPEQGVALLAGLLVAFGFAAWRNVAGSRRATVVLAAGGALLLAAASRLPVLAWTSSGAYNLPVYPGLPEIALLAAFLALGTGVGSQLDVEDVEASATLLGWFAIAIVLATAALGRADGMHVFLNSLGPLLAAAALASRRRLAAAWVVVGALCFAVVTYAWSLTTIGSLPLRHMPDDGAPIAALSGISRIAVAAPLSGSLGENLALRHALVPMYGWDLFDASEVISAVSGAEHADYLLMSTANYTRFSRVVAPADGFRMMQPRMTESPKWARTLYGIPITALGRHQMLDGPGSLYPDLLARFTIVRQVGDWVLLRRR